MPEFVVPYCKEPEDDPWWEDEPDGDVAAHSITNSIVRPVEHDESTIVYHTDLSVRHSIIIIYCIKFLQSDRVNE